MHPAGFLLGFTRFIAFSILFTCSLLVFILACVVVAHNKNHSNSFDGLFYYGYSYNLGGPGFLIFTGIIGIFTFGSLLLVNLKREMSLRAKVSKLWIEIVVLALFWIFFSAGAGATYSNFFFANVSDYSIVQALLAFAWIGFVVSFITMVCLIVGGLLTQSTSNQIWVVEMPDIKNINNPPMEPPVSNSTGMGNTPMQNVPVVEAKVENSQV